jgi:peroxiredoxin
MNEQVQTMWDRMPENKSKPKQQELKIGLGVASLILGIVSVAMAILVTGLLFGLIGIILGVACLAGSSIGKKMAGWGVGLSILGILLSCFFALSYYAAYKMPFQDYPYEYSSIQDEYTLDNWVGKALPDCNMVDIDGNKIQFSDFRGQQLVINCWSPWQLRDRDAIPHFISLRNEIPEKDLVIVGLSWENFEELKTIKQNLDINYPLVSSQDSVPPLNLFYPTPGTLFVDDTGIIVGVLEEYHDLKKIQSHMKALKNSKEKGVTSVPVTNP